MSLEVPRGCFNPTVNTRLLARVRAGMARNTEVSYYLPYELIMEIENHVEKNGYQSKSEYAREVFAEDLGVTLDG